MRLKRKFNFNDASKVDSIHTFNVSNRQHAKKTHLGIKDILL